MQTRFRGTGATHGEGWQGRRACKETCMYVCAGEARRSRLVAVGGQLTSGAFSSIRGGLFRSLSPGPSTQHMSVSALSARPALVEKLV